jgi:hypothetical protein
VYILLIIAVSSMCDDDGVVVATEYRGMPSASSLKSRSSAFLRPINAASVIVPAFTSQMERMMRSGLWDGEVPFGRN